MADWDRAVWSADVPTGSRLVVSVRAGSTAKPDDSWSAWKAVTNTGRIPASSRYLQYEVELSSPVSASPPALYAIGFSNNATPVADEREGR